MTVKQIWLRLFQFTLFLAALILLSTMQTSFWLQVFGYWPAPNMWIPVLVYFALYNQIIPLFWFIYLCFWVLSTLTLIPDGILILLIMSIGLFTRFFKRRIYWSGSTYFMLACSGASLLFNALHCILSLSFEADPMRSPQIATWLGQALLTTIPAFILFPIFQWFDKLTQRESTEASAELIS